MAKKSSTPPSQKTVLAKDKSKTETIYSEQSSALISFDVKTKIFLYICLGLYFIAVIFKLHTSSIPIWNQVANDGSNFKKGLVLGKPLSIRSDEWLVGSTFILSQVNTNFPTSNPSLGYGKTPLLMSLPTHNFLSYIRPQLIGFYFLDVESAFSLWWNFRIFGFIISFFLFLKIITSNDFWVSLSGTLFVFFSSIIIWWSINTDILIYAATAFIALTYILYEKTSFIRMLLFGFLFSIAGLNFIFNLYPPYQIPVVYIFSILLVGFVLDTYNKDSLLSLLPKKILTITFSLVLVGLAIFIFYTETQDTLRTVMSTVYPGQRNEKGGELIFVDLFKEMFHIFLTQEKYPSTWANMSELSSSLLASFAVIPFVIFGFFTRQKHSFMVVGLLCVQLLFLCWIVLGLPSFLAKITLFYMSPSYRMVYGLCISNAIIIFLYISRYRNSIPKNFLLLSCTVFVLFALFLANAINSNTSGFFTTTQVLISSFIFAFVSIFIVLATQKEIFKYVLLGFVVIFSLHNITANPLSKGLKPILDNRLSKTVTQLPNDVKKKGWVVFGQFTYSNFLKASGLNVISGVQYAPPIERLKFLDPTSKKDSVYNRYAHISFYPYIDGRDSVIFNLLQSDAYAIQMDPCSNRLRKMGIEYVVFTYVPQPAETRCMELVDRSSLPIYRIKD